MSSSANHIARDDYRPFRVGRKLMVIPAWLDPDLEPDTLPILLDPGATFGTGAHATTKLCLMALERHLKPGDSVLDLGTGSGILAIAAARLGASSVLAVDIDPESVNVATENVALNGLSEIVCVEEGSLADVINQEREVQQVSVVVANILSRVIVDFFDRGLLDTIDPGGLLILSGLLRSQTPQINATLRRHGVKTLGQEQMEEWICLIAGRPQGN